MTPDRTDIITRERFKAWAEVLKKWTATPVVVVAVGHGPESGTLNVVQVEDVSREQLVYFLRYALEQLEREEGGVQ